MDANLPLSLKISSRRAVSCLVGRDSAGTSLIVGKLFLFSGATAVPPMTTLGTLVLLSLTSGNS
jgi:hypothetical protein